MDVTKKRDPKNNIPVGKDLKVCLEAGFAHLWSLEFEPLG